MGLELWLPWQHIRFNGEKIIKKILWNHKAHSFDIWYVAMANGPLHKLCHSCPWGQIWPHLGVDSLHRLTIGKLNSGFHGNIYVLMGEKRKSSRPRALIFGMWRWLMVLYINYVIHASGVKFSHTPGVDSLHKLNTIGKNLQTPPLALLLFCK